MPRPQGIRIDTAVWVLPVLRRIVGAHVEHNVYFRDFPKNVPDTVEFWIERLLAALGPELGSLDIAVDPRLGFANLSALPEYGTYRHDYAEMVAAHDELIASAKDRITVLHAGAPLAEEVSALYLSMAGSVTPLGEEDLAVLLELALYCATGAQPQSIPVRAPLAGSPAAQCFRRLLEGACGAHRLRPVRVAAGCGVQELRLGLVHQSHRGRRRAFRRYHRRAERGLGVHRPPARRRAGGDGGAAGEHLLR